MKRFLITFTVLGIEAVIATVTLILLALDGSEIVDPKKLEPLFAFCYMMVLGLILLLPLALLQDCLNLYKPRNSMARRDDVNDQPDARKST